MIFSYKEWKNGSISFYQELQTIENHLAFEKAVFILTREIPASDTAKTSKTIIIHY